ncbi:MAG: hypothetical protein HZB99_00575 [Candidatus Harrisonbacteria bacterium]|nr:hypothetical protein [Candidatus Harrisonbacteria bacterium]
MATKKQRNRETKKQAPCDGFTLAEILIYTAIMAIVGTLFTGILITVTKIQNRQSTSAEVEQQTNLVLQNIQRYVRESSLIDIATGTPATTLILRLEDPARDPVNIYLANNQIFVREAANSPSALTTDKIKVDRLIFIKTVTYPGRDSLQVDLVISFNSQNPEEQFTKTSNTNISRSGTAIFNTDINPTADNAFSLGSSLNKWKNLYLSGNLSQTSGTITFGNLTDDPSGANGTIYYNSDLQTFRAYQNDSWKDLGQWTYSSTDASIHNSNNGNIGIGTASPNDQLDVNGIIKLTGFKMPTGAQSNFVLTSNASGLGSWLPSVGEGNWELSGNNIYNKNSGGVGINTNNPTGKLEIKNGTLLVDGPANPILAGSYNAPGNTRGIYVSGKYAFLASSGLRIIDVSNPANPTQVSSVETDGSKGVFVAGKYAYVGTAENGLAIIDISNINNPTIVGTYNSPGDGRQVYVSGKYAYLADAGSGLQIIDISNPTLPTIAGNYNTPGDARGVYVTENYAYVTDGSAGLQIINIANPSVPSLTGIFNTPGSAEKVYVSGNYAYIADGSAGLQIINVSNPASPVLTGSYDTSGSAGDIKVSGKYAYIADGSNVLQIVDVSNPANPKPVGSYDNANDSSENIFIAGKFAYVTVGSAGIHIIDIKGANIISADIDNLTSNNINIKNNFYITGQLTANNAVNTGAGGIASEGIISSAHYLHVGKATAGSPPTPDCDSESEVGRIAIDFNSNRLYVCIGGSRGWDSASLSN